MQAYWRKTNDFVELLFKGRKGKHERRYLNFSRRRQKISNFRPPSWIQFMFKFVFFLFLCLWMTWPGRFCGVDIVTAGRKKR